jgi:hypothetical protein
MKIRLILTETCNRSCERCCNKQFDIGSLPTYQGPEAKDVNKLILTGGEPMLVPNKVREYTNWAKFVNPNILVYMYTAKVDDIRQSIDVLEHLDGITVTLHEQSDVEPFMKFADEVSQQGLFENRSLRLNVFNEVNIDLFTFNLLSMAGQWIIQNNIEWIDDVPLPKGETLMKAWRDYNEKE